MLVYVVDVEDDDKADVVSVLVDSCFLLAGKVRDIDVRFQDAFPPLDVEVLV